LTARKTLEFDGDADNVRYDRLTGYIWVGYGNGGIGIVNPTGEKVGSVPASLRQILITFTWQCLIEVRRKPRFWFTRPIEIKMESI
jgi:hypothetical protein